MFKHLHFGKAVRQVLLLELQCLFALAASEAGSTLKDMVGVHETLLPEQETLLPGLTPRPMSAWRKFKARKVATLRLRAKHGRDTETEVSNCFKRTSAGWGWGWGWAWG